MTDGNAWIPLLRKLVVFKFLFYIVSLEAINLDSFRTQFWIEEKKWYVTYDRWDDCNSSLLYTNPYCGKHWIRSSYATARLVTESTGLEPTTFPHVNYLSINNISEIDDVLWTQFTRLNHLVIEQNLNTVFEYIATRLDLSHLTSFSCNRADIEIPINDFVRILHSLPQLRSLSLPISILLFLFDRKWPRIVDLNITSPYPFPFVPLISIQIDSLWHSFNRLETMTFCRETFQDVARLFDNRAITLSTVMIRHSDHLADYDPRLITYEWLDKNTKLRQFDYFCNDAHIVFMWI
ncbi:unnamed protein product [Rotaria sordida]|uniref:Uncharacterized protein n=1 Tax=Rotaria sordida TaxID=392033 RepID=A0A815HP68_9BILA|nr:unnamed protein product [Rotaria sordida]CAF4011910.1 unnamed protein product [Rotaria sordida]